jgi:hypothetical protein
MRNMNRICLAIVTSCVAGCSLISLSPLIQSNTLDYHRVVEDVANNIMVTNVLRARDHAPLHYSDLASIQATTASAASVQATFPILAPSGSTTPGTIQLGGISLTNTPLINLATLDTDDFTRGITTPISGETIKHFLDQGLDPRIAMLLFFDGIKGYQDDFHVMLPEDYVRVRSDGKKTCPDTDDPHYYCINISAGEKVDNSPDNRREFWKYLTIVNYEYYGLYANEYHEIFRVGKFAPNTKTALKDVTPPDLTKVQFSSDGGIYAISPDARVTLCRSIGSADEVLQEARFRHSNNRLPMTTNDNFRILALTETAKPLGATSLLCTSSKIPVYPDSRLPIPILYTRSPQGMIEFLGGLLRLQNDIKRHITVGIEPGSGTLFDLPNNSDNARFVVPYRDGLYYVRDAIGGDHTLEVLALLNQIFDLYKSAKNIPRFPAITVAP